MVESRPRRSGPALALLTWLIARFVDADGAGWVGPDDAELRERFDDRFLSVIPPDVLVVTLASFAAYMREDLVLVAEEPLDVRVQLGDTRIEAAVTAAPPHRFTMLRAYPAATRVTDARVAAPTTRTSGVVPAAAIDVADSAHAEVGLVGLVLAGGAPERPIWAAARGWADLDRAVLLRPGHRFPAYSITKLITSTAVLRLVADGKVRLDDPANTYLRAVRLAAGAVTVRDLLTHTGGVDTPTPLYSDTVPDLASLAGPILGCGGTRGEYAYSNGGYAVLGQLIADVDGGTYTDAATRLVLAPLGMDDSSFPARWPRFEPDAVTGYELTPEGLFEGAPADICAMPAAGGMWTTAADLVRFGREWSSLLPPSLVREARGPHVATGTGTYIGLGWHLDRGGNLEGHTGGGLGAATSVLVHARTGRAWVALTNRQAPVEAVNARLARAAPAAP